MKIDDSSKTQQTLINDLLDSPITRYFLPADPQNSESVKAADTCNVFFAGRGSVIDEHTGKNKMIGMYRLMPLEELQAIYKPLANIFSRGIFFNNERPEIVRRFLQAPEKAACKTLAEKERLWEELTQQTLAVTGAGRIDSSALKMTLDTLLSSLEDQDKNYREALVDTAMGFFKSKMIPIERVHLFTVMHAFVTALASRKTTKPLFSSRVSWLQCLNDLNRHSKDVLVQLAIKGEIYGHTC